MRRFLDSAENNASSLSKLYKICRQPSVLTIFASLSINIVLSLGWGSEISIQKLNPTFGDRLIELTGDKFSFLGKLSTEQALASKAKSLGVSATNLELDLSSSTKASVLTKTHAEPSPKGSQNSKNNPVFSKETAGIEKVSTAEPFSRTRLPLAGTLEITSQFGWRTHPFLGNLNFHNGIDFGAAEGTTVLAVDRGQVAIADWHGGYGLTVIVEHNQGTTQTLYAHLSEILVAPGETVQPGQAIGRVGSTGYSTGPHLHFEQRELTAEGWIAVDPSSVLENNLTASNPYKEAAFTERLPIDNLETKLVGDRDKISPVRVPSVKQEVTPPRTAEFDAWVTELKQEFTNLNTKTLSSSHDYPQTACDQNLEGTVAIGAFVNAWGQIVRDPKILHGSDHEMLDRAAVDYIKNLRLPETVQPTAYQYVFQFHYDPNNCNSVEVD